MRKFVSAVLVAGLLAVWLSAKGPSYEAVYSYGGLQTPYVPVTGTPCEDYFFAETVTLPEFQVRLGECRDVVHGNSTIEILDQREAL